MSTEVCPCGFEGVNCTTISPGVTSPLEELCSAEGTRKCFIFEHKASCLCNCGFDGTFCQNKVEVLKHNRVLAIFVPVLIIFIAIGILIHNREQLKRTFLFPRINTVSSTNEKISPTFILFYRGIAAFLGIYFSVDIFIVSDGVAFKTFSTWTYLVFTLLFIVAFVLSMTFFLRAKNEGFSGDKLTYDSLETTNTEKLYLVLLQILMPTTLLVTIIVWIVIFPGSAAKDNQEELLLPVQFFLHGINVILLFTEIYISRISSSINFKTGRTHCWFMIIYANSYAVMHETRLVIENLMGYNHCPNYDFLGLETDLLVPWIIGLNIILFILYGAAVGLVKIKNRVLGIKEEEAMKEGQVSLKFTL